MSPTGIQRTIAIVILLSPWVYVPMPLKEVVFIIAGVLLFISTLDVKRQLNRNKENHNQEPVSTSDTPPAPHHHPSVPSI